MNLLNRILVALALLALAAGAISIAVLAWTIPNDSIAWLRDAVGWMEDNNEDTQKALLTLLAALVALVSLTALLIEFMPAGGSDVKVIDVQGGNVVLSTAAIGQRIEESVRSVPNVSDIKTVVKTRRKGVEVFLDLHVDPDAKLAEVAESAIQATRQVLADRVHVELVDKPRVRLHYRELRMQGAAARTPDPSPSVPAADPPTEEAAWAPGGTAGDETAVPATSLTPPPEGMLRQN